jgi:FMN-dependent NADH-azoreductase
MNRDAFTILRIDGSARYDGSVSRELADETVQHLMAEHPGARVLHRDLGAGLPLIDAAWVAANFTDPAERDAGQRAALALSDTLIDELRAADAVVMAVPMYNFGVPASVKAWVDLVCRARVTFRYTADGPEGLLPDRPVYLLLATGGVPAGSAVDFASGYLRHIWGFLGISDVRLVAADGLNRDATGTMDRAREQLRAALIRCAAA